MITEEFRNEVLQRLTAIEVSLRALAGNGQPGRLQILEDRANDLAERVERVERKQSMIVAFASGVSAAVSAFVTAIITWLRLAKHL